jgi:hypothetical protein
MKIHELFESESRQERIQDGIYRLEKDGLLSISDIGTQGLGSLDRLKSAAEFLSVNKQGKIIVDTNGKMIAINLNFRSRSNVIRDEVRTTDWDIKGKVSVTFYGGDGMEADWLPNVHMLTLSSCKFKSFKLNPMQLNEVTDISFRLDTEITSGLLGILKLPKLKSIFNDHLDSAKLKTALDIIKKHLGTKDISECMDELIEAGLKEYAKL